MLCYVLCYCCLRNRRLLVHLAFHTQVEVVYCPHCGCRCTAEYFVELAGLRQSRG